jgi:hypothetical protein
MLDAEKSCRNAPNVLAWFVWTTVPGRLYAEAKAPLPNATPPLFVQVIAPV